MKAFVVLASLLAAAIAAPAPSPGPANALEVKLPNRSIPIAAEEVRRRMTSSKVDTNNVLRKRTPGNVGDTPLFSDASVGSQDIDWHWQVYMCTGSDFQHTCNVYSFGTDGVCYSLPEPYWESTGSMGPDQGALCRLT